MTTAVSEDDNPIQKFNRIKNEIDLIEKDLEFYNKNVFLFINLLERIIYKQISFREILLRIEEF